MAPLPVPGAGATDDPRAILIVEDEPDTVASLLDLLRRDFPQAVLHVATSGAQGLDVLRHHRADLLIVDYRMPGMDGVEFLRQAATVAPGLPSVMVTAYPDLHVALRAIDEANVAKYLTKPLDPAEILAAVHQLLRPSPLRPS